MKHIIEHIHSKDGTTLYLQSWLPDDDIRAVIAVIHGWSDHSGRYMNLVEQVVPDGYAVYAIDLRGHGKSEGQRGHVNQWQEFRHDTTTLLDLLDERHPQQPLFLFGHSMGGLIVMEYAIHHPDRALNGVIASAPLLAEPNVSKVLQQIGAMISRIYPRFSMDPGADPTTVSRDAIVVEKYKNDPLGHNRATARLSTEMRAAQQFTLANLDGIQHPFLMFWGEADTLVPTSMNREVFRQVGAADRTHFAYKGGYHEPINDLDKEEVLKDVSNWLKDHL